jgi:ribosomal protein S18 acetylase RimI-like enzyme
MPDLEPLLRFWRAQDDLFQRVEPTWWGAAVSDRRFPRIQEANYARVETATPVGLGEVEAALHPALAWSGATRSHVVVFVPDEQTDLLTEASARGDRLVWDLVMEHRGTVARPGPAGSVREVERLDGAFWATFRHSAALFGIEDEVAVEELTAMELEVFLRAGRRWFVVPGVREPLAIAALIVLEGVGYLDQVATLPGFRRRGHATALTRRALAEAAASGAERTFLLAEPDGVAAAMYRRLGFRPVTQIASWISVR